MKKYIFAIVLAVLICGSFTACSGNGGIFDSMGEQNTSCNSDVGSSSEESQSSVSDNGRGNSSKFNPSPLDSISAEELEKMRIELYGDGGEGRFIDITAETNWVIDDFKRAGMQNGIVEFLTPDGSAIDLSRAKRAYGVYAHTYSLMFDFAFLRYAKPSYHITLKEPAIYDWNANSFLEDYSVRAEKSDYFKVQAGDVLENGLKVVSADYSIDNCGRAVGSGVTFSGELTLNGTLVLIDEYSQEYVEGMYFIPDASDGAVPCITPHERCESDCFINFDDKFAAAFDGPFIYLHTGGYSDEAISNLFRESKYVEAAVTVNKITMSYGDGTGYKNWADLVSADRLSS